MKLLFAFLAGILTTLSPCVLPVLPFVTTSSFNKNRLGPVFLGFGLLCSFVGVTLLVSSTGQLLGIDSEIVRKLAGLLLALSGFIFLSQTLSDKISSKLSFLLNIGSQNNHGASGSVWNEFLGGLLLGIVWTPCSGPSLGAALGLAAQGDSFLSASVILFSFGIGAVIPLMFVAYGARGLIGKLKAQSGSITIMKKSFGVLVIVFGVMTIFGWDKKFEAGLTNLLPESWINFITKF